MSPYPLSGLTKSSSANSTVPKALLSKQSIKEVAKEVRRMLDEKQFYGILVVIKHSKEKVGILLTGKVSYSRRDEYLTYENEILEKTRSKLGNVFFESTIQFQDV